MVRKAFLLFGDLCQSLQFAVYMNQNGSDRYFLYFFTFLGIAGHKGEKESLEHGKTWFGKPFCRLFFFLNFTVCRIYASKWLRRVLLFHFSCNCWN